MVKAPIPTPTHSVEREYARHILKYQRYYVSLVKDGLRTLLPRLRAEVSLETPQALVERMDANADEETKKLFDAIRNKLNSAFPDTTLRRWAKAMVKRTHGVSSRNQAKHIRKISKGEIEIEGILTSDKKLNPYFENIIDQNVGLIRSITEEKLPTFKNALVNAITQDAPVSEIAKMVRKNFKTTESKAHMIARDQVGKLNGALDEFHQKTIGVKRYRWRTVHDGAVRGNPGGKYPPKPGQNNHWKLDGKIFNWDKPPTMADGRKLNPKQDYQCRCYAEAVLDDII